MDDITTSGRPIATRVALAINALVAAVALAVKLAGSGGIAGELCYFTIQSNLIVVAVCALLAWRPDRFAWVAGAPRLVGLTCITVTGVVYYSLLAADEHYVGIAAVADVLAHAVSPILFVGTWLVLGPRGRLHARHVGALLAFVAFWVTLTLVRGAIIHVYPYDFVDVAANGYLAVIATILALTVAATALAAGAVRIDQRPAARVSASAGDVQHWGPSRASTTWGVKT